MGRCYEGCEWFRGVGGWCGIVNGDGDSVWVGVWDEKLWVGKAVEWWERGC